MTAPRSTELNHREVRSTAQLIAWAVHNFDFGETIPQLIEPEKFVGIIYEHLLRNRLAFKVQELHVSEAAPEVRALLDGQNGWRQVLGFHLYRDSDGSSAYVFFNQAN